MTESVERRSVAYARPGAIALALAGLLFGVFPVIRPFFEMPAAGDRDAYARAAEVMASPAWTASHLVAAAGFLLLPLGGLVLSGALARGKAAGQGPAGAVLLMLGSGILLVVSGGEALGLPAAGQAYLAGESQNLPELVGRVRGPAMFVLLPLGLISFAAAGIILAAGIWRSALLPRWAGIGLAIGLTLWMPLLPQTPRVIDGLVIAIAAFWLSIGLWRLSPISSDAGARKTAVGEGQA